ncbi:MAG TPA: cytochrome P460 family protein [Gammaproteobacteria bacterium]|nr:cytochrome P460 family protein [Gammaproteobacteria bacterium]
MKAVNVIAAALAVAATLFVGVTHGDLKSEEFALGVVSPDGSIRVPANFRTEYVMLGTWSVAGDADTGGSVGLHVVYAPKDAVISYRKTGRFPDGMVLVKELFNGRTENLTTGQATSAAEPAGYFVMVKDDKNRFPGHPLWGDGWGWSFFKPGDTVSATTKSYAQECLGCHVPARSTDFVYIQGYPVLEQ